MNLPWRVFCPRQGNKIKVVVLNRVYIFAAERPKGASSNIIRI